jgi:hypothetical protein
MHRFKLLPSLLAATLLFAMGAMASAQQSPKPDPELTKLHAFLGHWKYEGEVKPGPWGPGGEIAGEATTQMTLGGFVMRTIEKQKGSGMTVALGIDTYDPSNKDFSSNWYYADGSIFSGTLVPNGNTFTWTGKFILAGKPYLLKMPLVFSPDLKSATETGEVSVDGRTWAPFIEAKLLRVIPSAKK